MTFAPPRPSTFFGKPGAASGITSPIDWRLGAQAGQNIGGALKNLGDIGGKVLTTKAQSKNMGDKARKALRIFKDDLELADSDIDAYSRAEAEGVLAQVPMMYKRWAEEDTQEHRAKALALQREALALQRESAEARTDYYGAQTTRLADEKDRFDRFNESLQVSAANAEDVDKDRNYFLSQPGNTKEKWEEQATDADKQAVKYFNSSSVQQVMQGAQFTPDEWLNFGGDAAQLTITRDPDSGATIVEKGKIFQVVRDIDPPQASAVQVQKQADVMTARGNYTAAVSHQFGGEKSTQLDNDGNVQIVNRHQYNQEQTAAAREYGLSKVGARLRGRYRKAVDAIHRGVGGAEETKAVGVLQQIGDSIFKGAFEYDARGDPKRDNQLNPVVADADEANDRAQWFGNMGLPDAVFDPALALSQPWLSQNPQTP